MKILITGACGFIGFHLSCALLKDDFEVIGIDNFSDYYSTKLKKDRSKILNSYKKFSLIKKDISEIRSIKIPDIDCIINLAAQPGVRVTGNHYNQYFETNINGFKALLDFQVESGIKNLIFASSSSVYSGNSSKQHQESDLLEKPSSIYAATKIFNEILAEDFHKKYNINAIGLRFFTVYGSWGRPDMAYFKFTDSILKNEKIKIFNSLSLSRDMTHISDVVIGIKSAIKYIHQSDNLYEIFNLGNTQKVTTRELIETISYNVGRTANFEIVKIEDEVKSTLASNLKSLRNLSYNPLLKFKEGYKEFYDWYKRYF